MSLEHRLRVPPRARLKLSQLDPASTPGVKGKAAALAALEKSHVRLFDLQYKLYAESTRALLVVLQGLDAAGKDGTIRHVMAVLNPQGCDVTPFKAPSKEDLDHDFLWRIHKVLPARGDIGIFNRSHYEDVLVVRVHGLVPKSVWSKRYDQINAFENELTEGGTTILKFFLHISKKQQKLRFEERLSDPARQWKISPDDFKERVFWDEYQSAYEDVLNRCSTPWAPWYVIPADRKWYRNFAVSRVIVETLEAMKLKIPKAKFDVSKIRIE